MEFGHVGVWYVYLLDRFKSSYFMINASVIAILINFFRTTSMWKSVHAVDKKKRVQHTQRDPALWCVLSDLEDFYSR